MCEGEYVRGIEDCLLIVFRLLSKAQTLEEANKALEPLKSKLDEKKLEKLRNELGLFDSF